MIRVLCAVHPRPVAQECSGYQLRCSQENWSPCLRRRSLKRSESFFVTWGLLKQPKKSELSSGWCLCAPETSQNIPLWSRSSPCPLHNFTVNGLMGWTTISGNVAVSKPSSWSGGGNRTVSHGLVSTELPNLRNLDRWGS